MLVIRLFRVGKRNQPAFKIVVTDKRKSATRGVYVEEVGFWNPLTKEKVLKQERIKYWLSVGAKPSSTIHNFLISEKIIEGKKTPVHKKKKVKEGAAEAEKTEVPAVKTEVPPVAETSKKEEPKPEVPQKEKPVEEEKVEEEPKNETSPASDSAEKEPAAETSDKEKKEEVSKEDKSSSVPSSSEEDSGKEEEKNKQN